MFRNYLKIAVRNLLKNKVYSLINIFGLAIGIAFCILTLLYVRYEWSYDTFHEKADRIFRVYYVQDKAGDRKIRPATPPALAPALKEEFPAIIRTARFNLMHGTNTVRYGEKSFRARIAYADPSFFDMFSFPQVVSDSQNLLRDVNAVVITRAMASKYFGRENPLGKTISADRGGGRFRDYTVRGVIEIPANSTIRFDFLAALENIMQGKQASSWQWHALTTYVELSDRARISDLDDPAPAFLETHYAGLPGMKLWFRPLTDVHLDPKVKQASAILSGIALSVLLIACINFMNLSVALSSTRFKEVGLRKVVGARRSQLVCQFWGEAILLSIIALFLGIALAELLLPSFNGLVEKDLSISYRNVWVSFLGLALLVGVVSGSYPALALSGSHPVEVLKGRLRIGGAGRFGKGLVLVQFCLSLVLIIATLVMTREMDYIRAKDLGFDLEHVIDVHMYGLDGAERRRTLDAYRNMVPQYPNLLSMTASQSAIGNEGSGDDSQFEHRFFHVDYDFFETLGMELKQGRDFSRDLASDAEESVIVNETFVRALGWESPIGKSMPPTVRTNKTIIGVVKDFHLASLHHQIKPTAIHLLRPDDPNQSFAHVFIRCRAEDVSATVDLLEATWKEIHPAHPFTYSFLDQDMERQYRTERRWDQMIRYAAVLAIFIACLGALGLTALAVARRTKEIGIRKVLGASVPRIVVLLSKEFTYLVIAANLVAWPAAYYAMTQWLQNFAYRIDLGIGIFVLGGLAVLVIAWLTVSYQAIRAALANPVDALRYE